MQCPLTGGRDRVRGGDGWERKGWERERERCRGISLKCWQHDQLLLGGKTTLNVTKLSDVKPSYQHGCCSRNQLKSITPHIRDGPVERLSISDLPPAQNISPDVTSRGKETSSCPWGPEATCTPATWLWHDPIVGALWRFYFIWVHLTWQSWTLLKQEFLTLRPPSLLVSLNMGRVVLSSTLTQIHTRRFYHLPTSVCMSRWSPSWDYSGSGASTSLDGVTKGTTITEYCSLLHNGWWGWETKSQRCPSC